MRQYDIAFFPSNSHNGLVNRPSNLLTLVSHRTAAVLFVLSDVCNFSLFSRSLSLSLSRHVRAFPLAAVCTRLHYVCSVHSVSIHCQRSIHWSYTMQTEATNKTKTITSQNAKNGLKWTISIRAWSKHWIATANNNNNETKKKKERNMLVNPHTQTDMPTVSIRMHCHSWACNLAAIR